MKVLDMDVSLDHMIKMLEKIRKIKGMTVFFLRGEYFHSKAIPNSKFDTFFSINFPNHLRLELP